MKLSTIEVPPDFRAKFILQAKDVKHRRTGLFIIPKYDNEGRAFPRGPLKMKSQYPEMDAVRLKSDVGVEYVVRRTEVSTISSREIVREWLLELFREEVGKAFCASDLKNAASILRMPEVAVWSKLNKARRIGIRTPDWFK